MLRRVRESLNFANLIMMKNNFNKIYSKEELRNNRMVTVVTLPLEESIMFPVAQAIDLMKQGENIIYFSFNHDSNKIDDFFTGFLNGEENIESITGQRALLDVHQIPLGKGWLEYCEGMISSIKQQCEVEFVFFDVLTFVKDEKAVSEGLYELGQKLKVTPIIVKTLDGPVFTSVQDMDKYQEAIDDLSQKDILKEMMESSINILSTSDYILGIQRHKESWWKKVWRKIKNFLLFWRKRDSFENNFQIRVIKNRRGKDGVTFDASMDLENPKIEIL